MAQFFSWFFITTPKDIIRIGHNFLLWGWQYFSIGYFLPRLFSPWHRDITGYGRGFDLQRWIKVFSWNLISRLIGAIMRIFVIVFGVVVEFFILLFTLLILITWMCVLLLAPALFLLGFFTLFL